MLDHVLFDTTDFDTQDDTHSIGAYVRSGKSGALITHHASSEADPTTFDFVDGDVTVGTDSVAETAHGMNTGDVIQLTSTGTLPAGLALATDYYVIRTDADNFKLAASELDAERGTAVDITAAAGGGTHTVTGQARDLRALDVYMVNEIDVRDLSHTQDSIRLGDGTDLVTTTTDGGDIGLDVNIINDTLAVTQSGTWDIGTVTTLTGITNDVSIDDGGNSITIDDGGLSLTVDASDLDIRDLTHVSDSVRLGDGTTFISDGDGNSDNIANTFNALDTRGFMFGYDASGDNWDRLQSTSGALHVDIQDASITVDDVALANISIVSNQNLLGVADTAEDVVASPLADRKYLWIYNNDNRKMYIGGTGVTSTTGFPISPGSYMEMRLGSAVDIEWVSAKVNHDLRHMESK